MSPRRALRAGQQLKRSADDRITPGDFRCFSTRSSACKGAKVARNAPGAGGCKQAQTFDVNRLAKNYTVKINSYAKQASWQDACWVLLDMPHAEVQPNVYSYSAAISACEKGGQWQQALGLFGAMPQAKVKPDVISYNAAISACEKGGQWQRALGLFGAMPQAKVQPDVISYSAAISACEKRGQWQQALGLFGAMPQAKVKPGVISYNAAISACEKGGQWQRALGLFGAMPQAKVQPNMISYSAAISACEKGGQWQQALGLFGAMPQAKVEPGVISYSAAISACEKGGQWQRALGLFGAMSQAKVKPGVISYNAAISACEKGGQWQRALGLFGAMPQATVLPDVISYNAVLDATFEKSHGPQCFDRGLSENVFCKLMNATPHTVDLHDLSEGAAQLAVRWWLATLVVPSIGKGLCASKPFKCIIITGYGRSRKGWDTTDVQTAVLNMLRTMKLSAGVLETNAGRLQLVLRKRDMRMLQQCFKQRKPRLRGRGGPRLAFPSNLKSSGTTPFTPQAPFSYQYHHIPLPHVQSNLLGLDPGGGGAGESQTWGT